MPLTMAKRNSLEGRESPFRGTQRLSQVPLEPAEEADIEAPKTIPFRAVCASEP